MANTSDEDRLAELGYTETLSRGWGLLQNFGVSFSIISIVTGCTTFFQYGLTTGGPAVMVWGWIMVIFFTSFVAAGMAEIVSAVPSAGGPYYWSAVLAPKQTSAFWSWVTGWFNFLGQVAVTTGISFGLAQLVSAAASMDGYVPTPGKTIGIFAAIIVSHGLINTFAVKWLVYLNNFSIACHSLGVFSLCVAVLAKAPTHQSAKFVFTTFTDMTAAEGTVTWSERASPAYVAVIGILMAQYTITGFDASAHLAEETHNAARSAPLGVIMSVGASAVFGWLFIVSFLFSIQDYETTIASDSGQPIFQILLDVFGPASAKALIALILICVYCAGLFSCTSNSRMYYSFARDRGIPGWFDHVSERWECPTRTIWLAVFLSFCLALPSLGSAVAFSAATSIATIGLYISYVLPILLATCYHEQFKKIRGPFHLGKFSRFNGVIATAWVCFIMVVFCLPTLNPVGQETLNYTPVAVGIVFAGTLISWFAFARKSFTGPLAHLVEEGAIDPAVLAAKENELSPERRPSDAEKLKKEKIAVRVV